MSPTILALFSVRGVDRQFRRKHGGGIHNFEHRCRPHCGRQTRWCCDWVRMMERGC